MAQDRTNLNKKGGVLQCKPTKANKEAHTHMNNDTTITNFPSFDYHAYDLDSISNLSQLIKSQEISGYSVALLSETYVTLKAISWLKKKYQLKVIDISVKDLSKKIYFGNSEKKDLKNVTKILSLLTEVSFYNHPPLFELDDRTGDLKTLFLYKKFDYVVNQVLNKTGHDYIKINANIYLHYLNKLKKQQRAYFVFLEKLYQESKAYLERATFCTTYSRQRISLHRITKTFNPQNKHTAKEIFDSGEITLKKIFGNNIDLQIKKLAQSLITKEELNRFSAKRIGFFNSSITPISHLFTEQSVVNDKTFYPDSRIIRELEK